MKDSSDFAAGCVAAVIAGVGYIAVWAASIAFVVWVVIHVLRALGALH